MRSAARRAAETAQGVVTASAGNMAQGVAWAARELGVPATIVAPEHAPQTKLDAIERLGGRVVKVPYERWWEIMTTSRYDDAEGLFVHPVQDERVMAGNGTIGLELAEELPDADAVLVPWGGGGLFTGIASALAALRPGDRVYAVQPETGAAVSAALAAGEPSEAPGFAPSFVDGAGARSSCRRCGSAHGRCSPAPSGVARRDRSGSAPARRARAGGRGGRGRARRRGRAVRPRARTQARLHRLRREHRRRPAGGDPPRRDAGLARLPRQRSTNQTAAKSAAVRVVTTVVVIPLKSRSVTRKTTAVIPIARKTMPTIAKTLEIWSSASLSRSRKRIRWNADGAIRNTEPASVHSSATM